MSPLLKCRNEEAIHDLRDLSILFLSLSPSLILPLLLPPLPLSFSLSPFPSPSFLLPLSLSLSLLHTPLALEEASCCTSLGNLLHTTKIPDSQSMRNYDQPTHLSELRNGSFSPSCASLAAAHETPYHRAHTELSPFPHSCSLN